MSETFDDTNIADTPSFEKARQQELARRQAVDDLLPHLPPPPHQLSPEKLAEELEQYRIEALEQLADVDEEHMYLHAVKNLFEEEMHPQKPKFPSEQKDNILRSEKPYIGLAIGYARIGDIAMAKQLISDFAILSTNYEDTWLMPQEFKRRLSATNYFTSDLTTEELKAHMNQFKLEIEEAELAKVAYYSGWVGGLSTPERITEFAKTVTDPTMDYFVLSPEEELVYKELEDAYTTHKGEQYIFDELGRIMQEGEALRILKKEDLGFARAGAFWREELGRLTKYDSDKNAIAKLLISIAIQKHSEHLAAISAEEAGLPDRPYMDL